MLDIPLRRWKDQLVDPIARRVPPFLTPAHITLAAFVCGLLSCAAATTSPHKPLATYLWLLNRLLDCLDGSVARTRNDATDLGGFLDLLSDFIIYSLLPIAVCLGLGHNHSTPASDVTVSVNWPALALLEASFHVNNFVLFYSAAVAATRHSDELTSVTMRPALVEGFESGLLFTAMLIWPHHINVWMSVMGLGVAVGICQRVLAVTSILRRVDSNGDRKAR